MPPGKPGTLFLGLALSLTGGGLSSSVAFLAEIGKRAGCWWVRNVEGFLQREVREREGMGAAPVPAPSITSTGN